MQNDLTILTVVHNDSGIFDLLISSIYKFTNPVPKIIVCDNGGSDKVLSKYINDPNIKIIDNKKISVHGSLAHGISLNKIFNMVTTKRTAIIESDCVLLKNGWDHLETGKRIIAAKKEGTSCFHVCFLVFETELLRGIDFRPGSLGNVDRSYQAFEDVGWQISLKMKLADLQEAKAVDCKKGSGKYFDSSFQSDELWLNGEPIVCHFGRGSNINGKAIKKGFKHPKEQLIEWKNIVEGLIR